MPNDTAGFSNSGINYGLGSFGSSDVGKWVLPLNSEGESWWKPFKSEWLMGRDPKASEYQGEHHDQLNSLINQGLMTAQGRQAPQLNGMQQDQFRQMQMAQAQQLQGIASGQQQGAGELAVQRQMQNALAGTQAQARMRGAGGMGMLMAGRNAQGIGLNAAGAGQQAAMQDQTNAQGMLTGALGSGRGQDIGYANSNAQLQQNQTALNDQQYRALLQQLGQGDQAQLAAYQAAQDRNKGHLGDMMQVGGGMIGAFMSDATVKKDIVANGPDVDAMMDALKPYSYSYKEDRHGVGPRAGIMAQDLEKSAAGKQVIRETADGKALDINKALSASLAMNARLNERVRKLEGQ